MTSKIIRNEPLTRPWAGTDPFIFMAHHLDHYPSSDGDQGVPTDKFGGRPLGDDFSREDGFSMYYGTSVPGFPAHPHRGFETVTIVPQGLVDHADSAGATARYGDGDVQWLTAGRGVMHSEMFPLRHADQDNPLDLYQIWLNLPAKKKMADPAFVMMWDGTIPRYRVTNDQGATAEVKVIAGAYQPQESAEDIITPPPPAPDSYASDLQADVAIWQLTLDPGAEVTLPPASKEAARRTLYFHAGSALTVDGTPLPANQLIEVVAGEPLRLHNSGDEVVEIMLLQGVPINEPVVAHGPFVMNSDAEIMQARRDFGATQFGGWPWSESGPVHPTGTGRFAKYPGAFERDVPPA